MQFCLSSTSLLLVKNISIFFRDFFPLKSDKFNQIQVDGTWVMSAEKKQFTVTAWEHKEGTCCDGMCSPFQCRWENRPRPSWGLWVLSSTAFPALSIPDHPPLCRPWAPAHSWPFQNVQLLTPSAQIGQDSHHDLYDKYQIYRFQFPMPLTSYGGRSVVCIPFHDIRQLSSRQRHLRFLSRQGDTWRTSLACWQPDLTTENVYNDFSFVSRLLRCDLV